MAEPGVIGGVPFNDLARAATAMAGAVEAAVLGVLRSGWYVLGPVTESFEHEFASWCGTRGCVGVANGTDAIELALRAVGVEAGDEVIAAANAGGYTSIACRSMGAVPVYADVDPVTLGLDPDSVAAAVSPRTAAVVVTHLYGIVADVAGLRDVLPAGLPVVEDAAQAHGAQVLNGRAGSAGDAASFSFYPTKNLGGFGDGGAVVSNREDVLDRVRSLRQYGWQSRNDAMMSGGRNSRLDELQAAVLRVKLPHVDDWNDRRREVAARYRSSLGGLVECVSSAERDDVSHLCVIRHPERDTLRRQLDGDGIATAVHFPIPDFAQAAFAGVAMTPSPLPVTGAACDQVLSLPCFPEIHDEEVRRVIEALEARLAKLGDRA